MLFAFLSIVQVTLERAVYSLFSVLFYFCLAVAVFHYFGWVERLIWFCIEKEASKILNGAQLTLGSFRLDWSALLQGKITLHASNLVLHTPQRQVWGWESPLIARIGKVVVEVNAPITIVHELFLGQKLPLEIYTIYVADVQVFVERHDQVINVYLCDPAAVLPPPPYLTSSPLTSPSLATTTTALQPNLPVVEAAAPVAESSADVLVRRSLSDPLVGMITPSHSEDDTENDTNNILQRENDAKNLKRAMSIPSEAASSAISTTTTSTCTGEEIHKAQAQKLVSEMLLAVQSLGRAARKGSLHTAVKQQGMEIAEKLRDGLSTRNRNTSNLEQGVALMEQVGKVAVESLTAPKLILPERNVGKGGPKPPMARVGRIVVKDARIFTKDSWIQITTHDDKNHRMTKLKEHTGAFGATSSTISGTNKDDPAPSSLKHGNWNRPIYIEALVVRAAELCPPMSLKDPTNPDLPALYQPMDKILEIVWRRLLAEMAKSNGGRLFSTAVGEVLSFIQSNPQHQPQSQNSSGNTTATISTAATTTVSSTPSATRTTPKIPSTVTSVEHGGTSMTENPGMASSQSKTPISRSADVGSKLFESATSEGISTKEMTIEEVQV